MNIIILLKVILGFILTGGVLSLILQTATPIIATILISILVFLVFVVFWNAIGIKIVKFFKRTKNLIKSALDSEEKRSFIQLISAITISVGGLIIIICIMASSFSSDNDNEDATNLIVAGETTTKPTPVEEETTTEETTTEETTPGETTTDETTTEETTKKENSTKKVVVSRPEIETTLKNQEEIESSKKYEFNIVGEDVAKEPVSTTNNSNLNLNPPIKNGNYTDITISEPTTQNKTDETKNPVIPTFPVEFETTTTEEIITQETTTEETTTKPTPIEEETTLVRVTPETNINISYTTGATLANVLVTFDTAVDASFKIYFDNVETNNYVLKKNSDKSYSIKVIVPSNYLGRLIIKVFDENGNVLKNKIKVINNQ